jgi:hypothetical protein
MKMITMAVVVWIGIALAVQAGSIPSSITYQGSLKQSGLPASGNMNMLFRITSQDGTQVYWSSGNMQVSVTNGLFSAHISPAGVDWQNVTPYMEVSVEGQLLLPREPVNATPYALMCDSVANEKGMIAMFVTDCPAGWTRFTALDNAFPMGGSSYGATGGSASHNHTLLEGPQQGMDSPSLVGVSSHGGTMGAYPWGSSNYGMNPTQDTTTTSSNLPPYVTVVWCQKS